MIEHSRVYVVVSIENTSSRALSSALASLGSLQPRPLEFLNTVDPLVSVSNLYLVLVSFIGSEIKFSSFC